jgi:hypothetical protein
MMTKTAGTFVGLISAYNEAPSIGEAVRSLFGVGCDEVLVVDGAWRNPDGRLFGPTPWSTDGMDREARAAGATYVRGINGTDGQKRDAAVRSCAAVFACVTHVFILDADERAEGSLAKAPDGHGCVLRHADKPNDLPTYRRAFPAGDYGPVVPLIRWLRWSPTLRCEKPGRYLEDGEPIRVYRRRGEEVETVLPVLSGIRIRHTVEADAERVAAKRRYYQVGEV